MVSITAVKTMFFVGFAFMRTEQECNFSCALEILSTAIGSSNTLGMVVTYRGLAFICAIEHVFPNAKHLFCKCDIGRNVYTKCWPFFYNDPTTSAGMLEQL